MRWRDELKARWGEARLSVLWMLGAFGGVPGARRLYRALLRRLVRGTGLFDPAFYLDSNEDLTGQNVRALSHYVTRGDREGRQPMAFFDPLHYLAQIDGRLRRVNSLLHFAWVGVHRRVSPSAWFDIDFYLTQNKDVARAGINPLLHYWKWGGLEGRSPSALFDGAYYLRSNPDVEKARVNPLLHYLRSGRFERRKALPDQEEHDGTGCRGHLLPSDDVWERLRPRSGDALAEVDVVVPVYKGYVETLLCVHSVLAAQVRTRFELVVIDDASPEAPLAEKLRELATRRLFTLINNRHNRGFVATVNLGMSLHPDRDVVLLNADTEVYDGWLDRLRATARRAPRTGTVTPLSNNATICSYPRFNHDNPFPLEIDYRDLDREAAVVNAGVEVVAPTGVAFCMYIGRACLEQTGPFDEATFGKGYGEENDFCQRAARLGWNNLIAADVFVRHWGATSFAAEKPARSAAAERKLARLHPRYHEQVARFIRQDPLAGARGRLDWARLRRLARERNVLLVCHSRGGGTERRVQEEIQRLTRAGYGVFLLRPEGDKPGHAALRHATAKSLPNVPSLKLADPVQLGARLGDLRITEIHIHSTVDFPAKAPALIGAAAAALGARIEVCLHDYEVICPRINLADDEGYYCGEQGASACNECLREERAAAPDIHAWRATYGALLTGAARIIVPDQDVAERLARYFPGVRFEVAPHEEPERERTAAPAVIQHGEKLRVVVIGAIGKLKGFDPLLGCARDARARDLAVDYSVLGYSMNDRLLEREGVVVTGKYRDEEAVERLALLRPHVVWLPSTWPETYSYTLSIALRAGCPVVAFDIGAIASRLSRLGDPHRLLPLRMAKAPAELNSFFCNYRIGRA